jgi:hypothetical protein
MRHGDEYGSLRKRLDDLDAKRRYAAAVAWERVVPERMASTVSRPVHRRSLCRRAKGSAVMGGFRPAANAERVRAPG